MENEGCLGGSVSWVSAFSSDHNPGTQDGALKWSTLLSGEAGCPSPSNLLMRELLLSLSQMNKNLKKKKTAAITGHYRADTSTQLDSQPCHH